MKYVRLQGLHYDSLHYQHSRSSPVRNGQKLSLMCGDCSRFLRILRRVQYFSPQTAARLSVTTR